MRKNLLLYNMQYNNSKFSLCCRCSCCTCWVTCFCSPLFWSLWICLWRCSLFWRIAICWSSWCFWLAICAGWCCRRRCCWSCSVCLFRSSWWVWWDTSCSWSWSGWLSGDICIFIIIIKCISIISATVFIWLNICISNWSKGSALTLYNCKTKYYNHYKSK